jgi:hypothetical protein
MKTKVVQIVTAMLELQDKGYFDISFNCKGNLFQAEIYRKNFHMHKYPDCQESIDLTADVESKLDEVLEMIEALKSMPTKDTNRVMIKPFPCYRREFVKGEKSGEWVKILPVIEYGDNAMQAMLMDGSGYYIDDPDNGVQYFVDMKSNENK